MPRQKTMTVTVSAALSAKVSRLAKLRHTTRSEIVREALRRYEPTERPSFTESAAEFCGAARGPGDLSTNPQRMDDYGK